MNNETPNAVSAGLNQTGVERLPYCAPKFASLGPIQSLVQHGGNIVSNDGDLVTDGTASGALISAWNRSSPATQRTTDALCGLFAESGLKLWRELRLGCGGFRPGRGRSHVSFLPASGIQ
jgi:hypothetical protein